MIKIDIDRLVLKIWKKVKNVQTSVTIVNNNDYESGTKKNENYLRITN